MTPLPRRALGRTGESLSVIGFGGILTMDETPAEAARVVAKAIEAGVNYFDVAPSYGNAEERLGPALEPRRREVFLACKTTDRTREGAERELKASLARLRTDRFDLYQMHCLALDEDVERAFGPGGALEAFVRARRDGLARYLGFSAHTEEAALAAMERFDFDTILFPLNRIAWHRGGFGPRAARPRRSGTRRATATALRCPRSRRSSRQRVSAAARGRARRAWAGTRGRTAARRRSP